MTLTASDLVCDFCQDADFFGFQDLWRHLLLCYEMNHDCILCGDKYSKLVGLGEHQRLDHQDKGTKTA